jgi:hypothetical protein
VNLIDFLSDLIKFVAGRYRGIVRPIHFFRGRGKFMGLRRLAAALFRHHSPHQPAKLRSVACDLLEPRRLLSASAVFTADGGTDWTDWYDAPEGTTVYANIYDDTYSSGGNVDWGNGDFVGVDWIDDHSAVASSYWDNNLPGELEWSPQPVTININGDMTYPLLHVYNVQPTADLNTNPDDGGLVTMTIADQSDPSSADTTAGFHYSFAETYTALATNYDDATDDVSKSYDFTTGGSHTIWSRIFDQDGGWSDLNSTVVLPTTNFTSNTSDSISFH